ncbi:SDR family NAD(P)-dependent oxidoreductase [Nitrosococcus wardiae]|uniref:SDR family NAD(P)-dependent oxidoreductase n=1 Tax=Nitrosococcus wardiae TaxID=1814290 RepID=A0A4P7BX79_9GAMM|nr:SDR family NAD(P)-dependent oxidoreductase [Nitrosococcus wardiae]QBQ54601.1 SDR family NAD(P)-dependent oxidoreductase [Nitrosococcus wardiae]
MNQKFASKSVLVTGCSSGIGRCVARGLQARGYRVFATARRTQDLEELTAEGLEAISLELSDEASIANTVDTVLERTGGQLYALFNNAAYGQPGAVEDLCREVLRAQLETNTLGTQELTNRLIPAMRNQGAGRIIYNSSVLGFIALPFRGAYNASKYALEALADTLRLELYGSGIKVSVIEPGPISSQFRHNSYQKYLENIDPTRSAHYQTYLAMEQRLKKCGPAVPFTLPPESVLKKVIHALEAPRPRARYYVTTPTHVFAALKRMLPHAAMDWILRQVSRSENR